MGDWSKNYISGWNNPFGSGINNAADRAIDSVHNDNEINALTPQKRKSYKAVCLSGQTNQTGKSRRFTNDFSLVSFDDGIARWKIRWSIEEEAYDTDVGRAFTESYGKNPFESGISEATRQSRIKSKPYAYSDIRGMQMKLTYLCRIEVVERGGIWFIKSVGGTALVSSTGTGTGEGTGSQDDFGRGSWTPGKMRKGDTKMPEGWTKAHIPVRVPTMRITSAFQQRSVYRRFHPGMDLAVGLGSPIFAIFDGIVVRTVKSCAVESPGCGKGTGGKGHRGFGNQVHLWHPGPGVISRYHHIQGKTTLKVGDKVTKGQVVAGCGSTGSSSGPHLHFEVWIPNKKFNNGNNVIDTSQIGDKNWYDIYQKQIGPGVAHETFDPIETSPFHEVDPTTIPEIIGWTVIPRKPGKKGTRTCKWINKERKGKVSNCTLGYITE